MNELRPVKTYSDLSALSLNCQTNFRLDEINKMKGYFECEIKERKVMIEKLSKYITSFDYCDKILIVLEATLSGVNTFSYLKTKKNTGLVSYVLVLFFSLSTAIVKKLLYETQKRKKKHNKILYLGKNKLYCI